MAKDLVCLDKIAKISLYESGVHVLLTLLHVLIYAQVLIFYPCRQGTTLLHNRDSQTFMA